MAMRGRLSNDLLLPVGGAFIVSTLIVALMINLLPWSGVWLQVKPDFVALVVLYWCIHQPRKVGFTVAFSLGLIMDVAEGSVFGQHALAYSVLAYAGLVLHRGFRHDRLTIASPRPCGGLSVASPKSVGITPPRTP